MSWFLFCWIRYYVSIWMMVRPSWWNRALSLLCSSVQTCSLSLPLLMDFMIARRKIMLFAWVCEWYLVVVVFYLLQILFLVYVFFIFRCFFSPFYSILALSLSFICVFFFLLNLLRIATALGRLSLLAFICAN